MTATHSTVWHVFIQKTDWSPVIKHAHPLNFDYKFRLIYLSDNLLHKFSEMQQLAPNYDVNNLMFFTRMC